MNCVDRPRALVAARARPHRHGAFRALAVADDQHVGHLLQLGLPDLISNLFLALVELDPQPGRRQLVPHRRGVGQVPVGNRQHDRLDRRQPERKRPGVVLDQDRDEPLEAAEDRPVDDDRPVLGVVGADVFQVEPLRQLVVELDRRALPLPADRVGDVEVDLRPVERAVALVDRVGLAGALERRLELRLGVVPGRDLAQELGRPRRELRLVAAGRSRRRRAARAAAAARLPRRSAPASRSSARRPARTGGRASGRTARPTLRCGAAASARGSAAAGRGSCAPRCRTRACGRGSSSPSRPSASPSDSTRNMFWR